jgi:hypothetical protein
VKRREIANLMDRSNSTGTSVADRVSWQSSSAGMPSVTTIYVAAG